MAELRWALIGLGVFFLGALGLWEWRRSARRAARPAEYHTEVDTARVERARRVEPSIDEFAGDESLDPDRSLEVPIIHPMEQMTVSVAAESAVDVPAAAQVARTASPVPVPEVVVATAQIRWPPENAERVVSLRIVHPRGEPMSGREIRFALETAGMRHGPQSIFHRVTAEGAVLASAANLVRPGNLDPQAMDEQSFRGLNLFCVLPGPVPAAQMFDELVHVARGVAARLAAVVQDDQGLLLDAQRQVLVRRAVVNPPPGDGAAP
jgi:FtsZ-interacting cell division protein ZipA